MTETPSASLPTLPFGRTGHASSRLVFGAAALARVSQADADQALAQIRAAGVNHIDTAASYGDSERRLAPFLRRHRQDVFLATKTGERSHAAAREQIRRSLERMGVDRIDLIQLHNLVQEADWQQAFAEDGALRACVEARDEGLVRAIGVTGHGTRVAAMHRRSLERFDFDSVLLPMNPRCCATRAMRKSSSSSSRSVPSAASPSRRSRASRGAAGPTAPRRPTTPGTSRSPTPRRSKAPCTGRSHARASSSTQRVICGYSARCCAPRRASRPARRPRAAPRTPTRPGHDRRRRSSCAASRRAPEEPGTAAEPRAPNRLGTVPQIG
ncbi:MAG: aldo/keto reductase [Myxococcota bacterium]|nr:aldo/keto reductase [Myxococcota bacterium]